MRPLFVVLLLVGMAGCVTHIPADKLNYVGDWQSEEARLLITGWGHVRFEEYRTLLGGDLTTGMKGPLQGFDGDNFTVGVGPVGSHFIVDKPPYFENGLWKMVVRHHELIKMNP